MGRRDDAELAFQLGIDGLEFLVDRLELLLRGLQLLRRRAVFLVQRLQLLVAGPQLLDGTFIPNAPGKLRFCAPSTRCAGAATRRVVARVPRRPGLSGSAVEEVDNRSRRGSLGGRQRA